MQCKVAVNDWFKKKISKKHTERRGTEEEYQRKHTENEQEGLKWDRGMSDISFFWSEKRTEVATLR